MILRTLSRHTIAIPSFYITNVALLLGLSSVLGDIYSSSRSIVITPKDCTVELFDSTLKDNVDRHTYTGEESNSYALKYKDKQLDSNTHAPLAPREFDITMTTVNSISSLDIKYPVVNISWSTPSNVTGLEGYVAETKFMYNGGLNTMRRAFVPNMNTSRYAPNTANYYDCLKIWTDKGDSVVRLSSLPHSYNNFVEAYIHYIDTDNKSSEFNTAKNWSTLMVVKSYPQENKAKVKFTAAPLDLPFTQYTICNNFSSEFPNVRITLNPTQRLPEREFYNIEPGVYQVWLLAHKDNEEIPDCDTAYRNNRVAAIVKNIDMSRNIAIYKTSSKPTIPFTTKADYNNRYHTNRSTVKQSEDNDGRIWTYVTGAVVAGVVALVLTAVLIMVRRKLFRVKKSSPPTSSSVVPEEENENKSTSKDLIVKVIPKRDLDNITDVTIITEPLKLFIVYSSDNDLHRRVVDRFALFLHRHCRCAVLLDTWCERELAELSPIRWLLRQLRSVDTILVIHSEGGTRRFNASLEGHIYEKKAKDSGYLEDIFVPAVGLLINDQQGGTQPKTRRVFNAYFSYSKKKTGVIDAMRGQTYELMRNIEELFLLMHGLSKSSKSGVSRVPVINYKEFSSVPEGKDLVKAIDAAECYHKDFPRWFDSIYMKQCSRETDLGNTVSPLTDLSNGKVTDIRQKDSSETENVNDSGLDSGIDNFEMICSRERPLQPNSEKKEFNQNDGNVDSVDELVAPESMHDDMSSIDSLTYDYTAREFNDDAEST